MRTVAVVLVALAVTVMAQNNRPVIGVLDQPLNGGPRTYIAASYVKYIEMAGGRVVPIHYNSTTAELSYLLSRLNCVLFTGGGTDLSPGSKFYATGRQIYDTAVAVNQNGGYFPIWGTCMGFQFLNVLCAASEDVLSTGYDSENYPIPLNFTSLAASSRTFSGASPYLMQVLARQNVTMNNHHDGVTPDQFVKNAALKSTFNVLATNVDRAGRVFVSHMEGIKLPFYGSQWHPEKNPFEWTLNEMLPHSADAVAVTQYTANFFINEARKSKQVFPENELQPYLIYNFNPVFTGAQGSDFTQEYIW